MSDEEDNGENVKANKEKAVGERELRGYRGKVGRNFKRVCPIPLAPGFTKREGSCTDTTKWNFKLTKSLEVDFVRGFRKWVKSRARLSRSQDGGYL
ncbi:hypothetical protein KM043_012466 [Ampulex compressa]|nr:hypothetical protein KM043_012466 [Ampulex compressa]